jgi:hypothetical protein
MMRQNPRGTFRKACAQVALAACAMSAVAWAQTAPGKVPDFSGFWERKDEFGGGSFGGTLERIPKASIKPEYIEQAKRQAAAQARGDVVSFASKWCQTFSYPFFMQHSAAWDIAQSQDEIVQASEIHTFARHIYLDGRKHPDAEHLQRSANGHAIGHWEGDTLVVDTIGFSAMGGTPGGGRVGPGTHLVERFKLADGGKILSVTSTWDDPAIYLKPHTYEMTYHRSDPGTYAFEEYCHADDEAQGGSVVAPPQK